MNLYVYSDDEEVTKRIDNILLTNKLPALFFSSLSDLTAALEDDLSATLIFHLKPEMELEFQSVQDKSKKKLKTLVICNTPDPEQGVRLLNLNIRGYSNSYIEPDKLITALSIIEQGEIWAGAALIQYMLNQTRAFINESQRVLPDPKNTVFQLLTSREQQIAQKILTGFQNKIIADELSITERTVKAHLSAIYKKLNVRNRLELTLKLQQADRRNEKIDRRAAS